MKKLLTGLFIFGTMTSAFAGFHATFDKKKNEIVVITTKEKDAHKQVIIKLNSAITEDEAMELLVLIQTYGSVIKFDDTRWEVLGDKIIRAY
jgi:hypothetical protein